MLGLPVPGIFLAQDQDTGKMLVIDGQQRLLSLLFFYDGHFNPNPDLDTKRVFRLKKVQPQYENSTYETLEPKERINLDNCVIHATVVKQDSPADDDTSVYHIFERLNSGGRKLTPQEIRSAVYHGYLIELVGELNNHKSWRNIYGRVNDRMKDRELIIRFFAIFDGHENYKPSMTEFLNLFCKKYRKGDHGRIDELANLFKVCCDAFDSALKNRIFRLGNALNVALYEAAMVGLATRVSTTGLPSDEAIVESYNLLNSFKEFNESISQATSNQKAVQLRTEIAQKVFMEA